MGLEVEGNLLLSLLLREYPMLSLSLLSLHGEN